MRLFILLSCFLAATPLATSQTLVDSIEQKIILEESAIPSNLSDESVLRFVEQFAIDQNATQLEQMVLGVAHLRPHLLDKSLKSVAEYMPQLSQNVVYYVSKYVPEQRKDVFITMAMYLEAQNRTKELAEMKSVNQSVLAEIQNQGLSVETAAGPEDDFQALLHEIGL